MPKRFETCTENTSYSYQPTAASLCILANRRQGRNASCPHAAGSRSQTPGAVMVAQTHMSHTWSASHSRIGHEVLPLLPPILLCQRLGSHHLRAVARPGSGRWGTMLVNASSDYPSLWPCYGWSPWKWTQFSFFPSSTIWFPPLGL